jgi:hypothetical protein
LSVDKRAVGIIGTLERALHRGDCGAAAARETGETLVTCEDVDGAARTVAATVT